MAKGTKPSGKVAVRRLRERLVTLMADPASDVLDDAALAKKVGVTEELLAEMLDEALVAEAMARRVREIEASELIEVDRAMLARAKEGHVGAARLLYGRIALRADVDDGSLPSLEELEAELAALRGRGK